MSPKLKISSCLFQKLSKLESEASVGSLFGLMYDSTLLVLGFCFEDDEDSIASVWSKLQLNFPTEIELCGVIKFETSGIAENKVKSILQNVDMTDNPLVLTLCGKTVKAHFLCHDRLQETSFDQVSDEDLLNQFIYIRLRATMPLFCEATPAGVREALQSKRKKMTSGQVSFHFPGSKVYIIGGDIDGTSSLCGLSENSNVEDLFNHLKNEIDSKKKTKNITEVEIIDANIILKQTRDVTSDKLVKTAVKMMSTQGKPAFCIKLPLQVDCLAMAHMKTKLIPIYNILVESACRSLRLLEKSLIEQLGLEGIGDGGGLRVPELLHFLLNDRKHFFTRTIPKGVSDDITAEERKNLHHSLCISMDKPVFKRTNAYRFENDDKEELLLNPHVFISSKPNKDPDTVVALVKGYYAYHHYMQNQFDDSGWGCAYRSLQTLWSWFRLQGYTDEAVPTHKQIQQCLVKIGDKTSSFIGSKNWIGSSEVGFCLDTLLGIQVKMICASSGSELPSYGQELVYHFQRHGTPIMIGGGVLAHTILGVEYNGNTGNIKYLILDPHYTGSEDISVVVGKGWCGWKNNDFWDKNAFYNLCLPLVQPCI